MSKVGSEKDAFAFPNTMEIQIVSRIIFLTHSPLNN
jgi:hypothetical protein